LRACSRKSLERAGQARMLALQFLRSSPGLFTEAKAKTDFARSNEIKTERFSINDKRSIQ
jgi:hypothetical protein